jgi:hypothetical protein
VISTETRFLDAYRAIRAELDRRIAQPDVVDTLVTFYTSLGADALVRSRSAEAVERGAQVKR